MQAKERFLTVATDLTGFCNLKCRMCYFHLDQGGEKVRVPHKQFRAMFGPFSDRIRTIGLSCSYEPLLARFRDLSGVLDFVEESRIPESFLITNGTCLSRRVARRLVHSPLTTLQVSFDTHVREKYQGIRVGANFNKVVENIRYFTECKRREGRTHPLLQLNAVLARGTIEDMPEYLDFIAALGAQAVDLRHLVIYQGFGLEEQSLHLHKALANEYFDRIREKCAALGLHIVCLPENFAAVEIPAPAAAQGEAPPPSAEKPPPSSESSGNPPSPPPSSMETPTPAPPPPPAETTVCTGRSCGIPSRFMSVLPNGDVRPCGFWYGEKPLGNLAEQTFDSLWNSEEYARLRENVARGILERPCCRTCPSVGSGNVDEEASFTSKRL